MRQISCGTSGTFLPNSGSSWQELHLDSLWLDVIDVLSPGSSPRSVQAIALKEHNILESHRNLIVSAPTNSGKSLVGLLVLLEAMRRQRRVVLLEPLRALAREKTDELERVAPQLSKVLGVKISVRISTGDYRLDDEFLSSPPPGGEIIVATPERLESLLRNPDNAAWLDTIGAVCVDEAHLISDSRRGTTLEYLITSLLGDTAPPRLVLLSATLGNVERAQTWLAPCDVVKVTQRQPPLHKWVIELSDDDDANASAAEWIDEPLQNPDAQVLVFVYKTDWAEKLASVLSQQLGKQAGEKGATLSELQTFLGRSLGGQLLVSQVLTALNWLESHLLAYLDPESKRYHLTVLGKKATRAVLPLPLAHGYAQLLRDLLTIDSKDELLSQWEPLDHLLVLDLLSERSPNLRKYSAKLAELVEGWCEGHSDAMPLLFRKWIRGKVDCSKASEIIGSLGIRLPKTGKAGEKWACETGYVSTFRAIVLYERSQGMKIDAIERWFGVKGLEGIEEKWRDDLLWLLSGLAQLLDVRTFYYHLKEDCQADLERVKRVKRLLGRMRYQVFELQEQIKYCSPLGPLLREIRRIAPKHKVKIGVQSIRRLEQAGISSLKDLMGFDLDELVKLGVQRGLAEQIRGYVRRRMQ